MNELLLMIIIVVLSGIVIYLVRDYDYRRMYRMNIDNILWTMETMLQGEHENRYIKVSLADGAKIPVKAHEGDAVIPKGTKVGQLFFVKQEKTCLRVSDITEDTSRGTDGFGSTDTNFNENVQKPRLNNV